MIKKRTLPNKNGPLFMSLSFVLLAILIVNLINIQVVRGNELYFTSRNGFSQIIIDRSIRGIIYDRNGVKLVDNVPKFKLYIKRHVKDEYSLSKTIANLSSLFQTDIESIYKKELERIAPYPNINQVKIFSNLDYNPYIFQIEANPQNFPLVIIESYMQRKYFYPEITSHILGYTGEVTADDYLTGKYNYGDEIGKFGVEKGFDSILRGQNGIKRIDIYGSNNKKVSSVITPKVNGQDIYLSIDIEVQKKLYELIEKAKTKPQFTDTISFGIVVEDITSGEIIAMASYPNFDSNKFSSGISEKDYQEYLNDPGKPLSNKATQYAQPPGSTFKVLTNLAALAKNIASKDTTYSTGGTFYYGGVTFVDYNRRNYGTINMVQALCVSSNIYHMKLALEMEEKTGGKASEIIYELFDAIGLNSSSGLNIGTEAIGYFPTPSDKKAKNEPWYTGYLLNSSIGQGEVKLTPIASLKMTATIASKGKIIPQTIILNGNKDKQFKNLNIESYKFDVIHEGMECATKANNQALGIKYEDYPQISIKTGSSETGEILNGKQVVHGWEISYAPAHKPKIAMSIFMENATHGWKGGYISREFYKFMHEKGKLE